MLTVAQVSNPPRGASSSASAHSSVLDTVPGQTDAGCWRGDKWCPLMEGQALLETEQIKPEHNSSVVRRELPTLLLDQEVQPSFLWGQHRWAEAVLATCN